MNTTVTYERYTSIHPSGRTRKTVSTPRMRQKRFRRLCVVFTVLFVLAVCGFYRLGTVAQADEIPSRREKYFTSIRVEAGDSLWSIAEDYVSPEYENISAYVDELMFMNGMTDSRIYVGDYITVTYYK